MLKHLFMKSVVGGEAAPAVEPLARAERVGAVEGGDAVLAGVVQDVVERGADLAGGAQDGGVVAVGEEGALAAPELVEGLGDADRQALHAARERAAVVGLDQAELLAGSPNAVQQPMFESTHADAPCGSRAPVGPGQSR